LGADFLCASFYCPCPSARISRSNDFARLGATNTGELRLKVTDPSGAGVKTTVQIVSEANQYRQALTSSDEGSLAVHRLPYGTYQVQEDSRDLRNSRNHRNLFLNPDRAHDPVDAHARKPDGYCERRHNPD
jgi:hypothetical protein